MASRYEFCAKDNIDIDIVLATSVQNLCFRANVSYSHTDDGVIDDFPKISDHFPKISEDFTKFVPKARRTFPNIFRTFSEDYRRLTKTTEEDPKMFRSYANKF